MTEWGTQPANHYLPRRKTRLRIRAAEIERADNPLKIDGLLALLFLVAGLIAERWFFFAQASHPQNLYCQSAA